AAHGPAGCRGGRVAGRRACACRAGRATPAAGHAARPAAACRCQPAAAPARGRVRGAQARARRPRCAGCGLGLARLVRRHPPRWRARAAPPWPSLRGACGLSSRARGQR
ncbi:MAG: hypothetical protein EOO54_10155, partial [Haliea sp.]